MRIERNDVYFAIKSYIEEKHISPTIRELCEIVGKSSPATIHYHLKNLKRDGYIDYDETKRRTIRIVKEIEDNGK